MMGVLRLLPVLQNTKHCFHRIAPSIDNAASVCLRWASSLRKSSGMVADSNRMEYWNKRWENKQIGFHKPDVHHMLIRNFDKLCTDRKPANIFLPLCGKTLDMKWLADKGIVTVGLDGVQSALEQFYTEHGLEWEETRVPALGPSGNLLSSKDGIFKLYCGDIMEFTQDVAGTFDAVWDRASIVALDRKDLESYVRVIKGLLKPGGRILMEILEYDLAIMNDLTGPRKPPPPYPMFEDDIKRLYEPEFTVEFLERDWRKLDGKDVQSAVLLLVKK